MNDRKFESNIQFDTIDNFVFEFDNFSINQRSNMIFVVVNLRKFARIRHFFLSRIDENDQKFDHFLRFERFERFFFASMLFSNFFNFFVKFLFWINSNTFVFFKIISTIQQFMNEHIDRLYDNQIELQHRFEFFENVVKYRMITKNDIITIRDDFIVFQFFVQRNMNEIIIKMNKMNKNNAKFENFVLFLMIFEKLKKSLTKTENLHQNKFFF